MTSDQPAFPDEPDLSAYPGLARVFENAKKSAAKGDADAMNVMGAFAGDGGDAENERAWFEKSAALGDTVALNQLGVMARAEGDRAKATDLWLRAAEGGNSDAMRNLGKLAQAAGDGDTARAWFAEADKHATEDDDLLGHMGGPGTAPPPVTS